MADREHAVVFLVGMRMDSDRPAETLARDVYFTPKPSWSLDDTLEFIFEMSQNEFNPIPNKRSSMAGDIILFKGILYSINSTGFIRLRRESF